MSKVAELMLDIEELVQLGMTEKYIAVTLNVPIQMVYDVIENLENEHIEKQHEMLSYADQMADQDAIYYGEN
jgi:orotate phosphoribosyltransferase-like protein